MDSNVTVRACLVEQNHQMGVYVSGSEGTIEASVVRSTPNALVNIEGGIFIEDDPDTNTRANVTVRACLIEKNLDLGIFVLGSDATIEATVIRSTLPSAQGTGGTGIFVQNDLTTKERAKVIVRACLVEKNHKLGVSILGADATIEATVVRSTLPAAEGTGGRGIDVFDIGTNTRANVTIRACVIEKNHYVGVYVEGSDATIEATVVRSTLPNAQGENGRGIAVHDSSDTNERANVTVRACLIEQNQDVGVFVAGSDAAIETTVVRSTLSAPPTPASLSCIGPVRDSATGCAGAGAGGF
jgi:hypothetical protein